MFKLKFTIIISIFIIKLQCSVINTPFPVLGVYSSEFNIQMLTLQCPLFTIQNFNVQKFTFSVHYSQFNVNTVQCSVFPSPVFTVHCSNSAFTVQMFKIKVQIQSSKFHVQVQSSGFNEGTWVSQVHVSDVWCPSISSVTFGVSHLRGSRSYT